MTEWIPCSDRLPDDHKNVLVAYENGVVWAAYVGAGEWYCVSGEPNTYGRITHWMDFPEPPHA